jgi:hypothetical protein
VQETAPDIVNLWFDKHLPNAYAVAKELSTWTNSTARLHFTAQSWILDLYFNCPTDMGLHCPTDDAKANVQEAITQVPTRVAARVLSSWC